MATQNTSLPKENTLYLTIKQEFFDQIIAGTKKAEYREIKPTTYKKYLVCDENGFPYFNTDRISEEQINQLVVEGMDILFIYNDAQCILFPNEDIHYLDLAVGYNKERDTATVEVVGFEFEPMKDPKNGKDIRFDFDKDGKPYRDDKNGRYCYWIIAFQLGEILCKNIVSKKK